MVSPALKHLDRPGKLRPKALAPLGVLGGCGLTPPFSRKGNLDGRRSIAPSTGDDIYVEATTVLLGISNANTWARSVSVDHPFVGAMFFECLLHRLNCVLRRIVWKCTQSDKIDVIFSTLALRIRSYSSAIGERTLQEDVVANLQAEVLCEESTQSVCCALNTIRLGLSKDELLVEGLKIFRELHASPLAVEQS